SQGMSTFPFESLRRFPDLESPELLASDAADRLLLSELQHEVEADPSLLEAGLVVIGDNYGAITLAAIADLGFTSVRVHQDARSGELALENNATELSITGFTLHGLDPELVRDARIVAMRLPRSLDQLDQWSAKQYFGMVVASLAVQKSRVLRVKEPQAEVALEALTSWPKSKRYDVIDMTVCAHGGVFSGINLDIGTRELLAVLDQTPQDATRIIDFGCGSGLLAVAIARLRHAATVIASDQSSAAVASAAATLEANGLGDRVEVVRDDGLASQPDASADLILFNPPFHSGAAVHSDTSVRLFAEAGRVLKPGGELWVVANSHLGYKPVLRDLVGETLEVKRTPKFTVTRSIKA
ncbi:MAG: hypothetical protein RLZZ52_1216, partial [Actinomycetota bacterium]